MSVQMQRAHEKAAEVDAKLTADDPGFRNATKIVTDEGCVFLFESAFLRMWTDPDDRKWLMCFSEHEGFHVWAEDDLHGYVEYFRVWAVEPLP